MRVLRYLTMAAMIFGLAGCGGGGGYGGGNGTPNLPPDVPPPPVMTHRWMGGVISPTNQLVAQLDIVEQPDGTFAGTWMGTEDFLSCTGAFGVDNSVTLTVDLGSETLVTYTGTIERHPDGRITGTLGENSLILNSY